MIASKFLCRASTTAPLIRSTLRPIARPNVLPKPASIRPLTATTHLYKEDKERRTPSAAERALSAEEKHEGAFSRTDNTVRIQHPEDEDHPPSEPVTGRGGMHFKRTLASFSLEQGVAVVTGGARGLGLVMSQACMLSGADVAIVDLNSMYKIL